MAIVVIGGQARNVGKTGVVCGLIAALPERRWTAIKLSQHGHGVAVLEERDRTTGTDSARYLAAGAARAFWISSDEGKPAAAMPYVRAAMKGAENVILESNSVLEFVRPDLYVVVLAPAMSDFKTSALRHLERANAVLVLGQTGAQLDWKSVPLPGIERIRTFSMDPPSYSSAEFTAFVEQKLERLGR
jgi:glycine/D-amino acid oxidase-like deaminating enzyme